MPKPNTDLQDDLMAAMRLLVAQERDVRACQETARARVGAGHDRVGSGIDSVKQYDVATANLQLVLERRKELGNVWGSNPEDMEGDLEKAQVHKLLVPLRLESMNIWRGGKQNDDDAPPDPKSRPLQSKSRNDPAAIGGPKTVSKKKRIRPRESSNLQYSPAHISKIFNPEDAVPRVTRNKSGVDVEDDKDLSDDEEEEEEEESEENYAKALSIASTGSNIVVYRPPSEPEDTVIPSFTKPASPQKRNKPTLKRQNPPKRKQTPVSMATISSRETVDLDRLQEVEDPPYAPQDMYTNVSEEAQRSIDNTPLPSPFKAASWDFSNIDVLEHADANTHEATSPTSPDDRVQSETDEEQATINDTPLPSPSKAASWDFTSLDALEDEYANTQKATLAIAPDDAVQAATSMSDFSFVTSNGTGLFVSDKKRPKRRAVVIAEGTVLGSAPSRIYFPTPSLAAEEDPPAGPARVNNNSESNIPPKNKAKKRKKAPSLDPAEAPPGNDKVRKRGKGTVEVSDLVSSSSRRPRPSRATMKNGVGLLVGGMSGVEDAMKAKPLSWQAKGRGKGVTRAIPLNEMVKKGVPDETG